MRVIFRANRSNTRFRLTDGREYEVLLSANGRYHVINDNHSVQPYDVRLFDVIDSSPVNTNTEETPNNQSAEEPISEPQQENIQPTRRRGRPTNAELEARRRAEAAQRAADEERRRAEELAARGAVRTEQDIADSIVFHQGVSNAISVSIDYRERMNDAPNISTHNLGVLHFNGSPISCGIVEVNGMGVFMHHLSNVLDFQESDWDILRPALYTKAGEYIQQLIDESYYNGAYSMMSIVTAYEPESEDDEDDHTHVEDIVRYFGYTEALPARINTNSENRICFLVRNRNL